MSVDGEVFMGEVEQELEWLNENFYNDPDFEDSMFVEYEILEEDLGQLYADELYFDEYQPENYFDEDVQMDYGDYYDYDNDDDNDDVGAYDDYHLMMAHTKTTTSRSIIVATLEMSNVNITTERCLNVYLTSLITHNNDNHQHDEDFDVDDDPDDADDEKKHEDHTTS